MYFLYVSLNLSATQMNISEQKRFLLAKMAFLTGAPRAENVLLQQPRRRKWPIGRPNKGSSPQYLQRQLKPKSDRS